MGTILLLVSKVCTINCISFQIFLFLMHIRLLDIIIFPICSYNNAKQRYMGNQDKTSARIHLVSAAEAGALVSLFLCCISSTLCRLINHRKKGFKRSSVFNFNPKVIMLWWQKRYLFRYVFLPILFGSWKLDYSFRLLIIRGVHILVLMVCSILYVKHAVMYQWFMVH